MTHLDFIKRRLLREAVHENAGTRPRLVSPGPGQEPQESHWGRHSILAAGMVLVFLFFSSAILRVAAGQRGVEPWSLLMTWVTEQRLASSTVEMLPEVLAPAVAPTSIDFEIFPLTVRKIALDPGHGGEDGGAVNPLDIGAGTTDFCMMNGRYPTEEDQRTLDIAGDAIDARLAVLVQERYPEAQFTIHMVRDWKEKRGFVGKAAEQVLVTVPVAGKPTRLDITNEMRSACESLVPPVTETMLELIARAEPEFQERVRQNIILAGGSSLIAGLIDRLQQGLAEVGGGQVRRVAEPAFAGSDGGLAIALDTLETDWELLTT